MAKNPLQEAEKALKAVTGKYRAQYLAGYGLPDVVRKAAEEQSPEIKLNRSGLEAKYTDPKYSDPKADTYVPPETRAALVRQEQQGARSYLSRVTDSASRLFDKDVQASRFGVEDAQSRYQGYADEATHQQRRAEALEDTEAKARISARFRGGNPKPTPYTTLADARKDALGFFLANYGDRKPDGQGGYGFFDAEGKPITVEQAAGFVPGASRADFLADSTNPQDIALKPKAPTVGEEKDQATYDYFANRIHNGEKKSKVIKDAKAQGYLHLIADLESE